MRFLVFGDSITYGAWDTQGGWADRLKRWAHEQYIQNDSKVQIYNLGIGGDTSAKIVGRISAEIQARRSVSWPITILLMCGTNDGRVSNDAIEVPIDAFTANIQSIITASQRWSAKVILVGLPPVASDDVHFKDFHYSSTTVAAYDAELQRIGFENGLDYINIRQCFDPKTMLYSDGLHPNDKGHEVIYQEVKNVLEKLLKNEQKA